MLATNKSWGHYDSSGSLRYAYGIKIPPKILLKTMAKKRKISSFIINLLWPVYTFMTAAEFFLECWKNAESGKTGEKGKTRRLWKFDKKRIICQKLSLPFEHSWISKNAEKSWNKKNFQNNAIKSENCRRFYHFRKKLNMRMLI